LKLKRLVIAEIAAIAVVLIVILVFEMTPYLISTENDTSVEVYSGKEYGSGSATIERGQMVRAPYFNYSTFDPAILVIDMDFQTWKSPGTLVLAVNGRVFSSVVATPDETHIGLKVISVSGADWVEPFSIYSSVFGNAISFSSDKNDGYEGLFNYRITIRGSR
jgi:hypothetical protein